MRPAHDDAPTVVTPVWRRPFAEDGDSGAVTVVRRLPSGPDPTVPVSAEMIMAAEQLSADGGAIDVAGDDGDSLSVPEASCTGAAPVQPMPIVGSPAGGASEREAATVEVETDGVMRGDDAFILAWGRSSEALRSRTWQLLLSMGLNCCLAAVVAYLGWRGDHRTPFVFVRDSLGNVVQAQASGFLRAGDTRSEVEIKGFVRRWVLDAFTFTPLDVEDRARAALRAVDGKAQAVVKAGMRLAERKALVESGTSGRVWEDARSGREPQVVILRREPLEVMVSFERYLIDAEGVKAEAGPLFARVMLREVPRSPANPHGLVVVDAQISERL